MRAGPGKEVEALEDEAEPAVADAGQRVAVERRHVLPVEQVAPGGGPVEAAEDVHQRGLAAPRRTPDGHELAGGDLQAHAAERAHLHVPHVEDLGDVLDRDERSGHRQCPTRTAAAPVLPAGRPGVAGRPALSTPVSTASPGCSGPESTSVKVPSETPTVTCAGAGLPSRRTQRLRPPALASRRRRTPASAPAPVATGHPCRARAPPSQGGEHLRRRPEPERGVRHPEHVLPLRVDDGHVGGHPRTELEVRVGHVDHRVVGHDVLLRLRRVADLANRSAEALVREGVHDEGGLHPRLELAHVGLGDDGVHLHLLQVPGEGEDGRRRSDAATVCPTSTLREMTVPSMGERILV